MNGNVALFKKKNKGGKKEGDKWDLLDKPTQVRAFVQCRSIPVVLSGGP